MRTVFNLLTLIILFLGVGITDAHAVDFHVGAGQTYLTIGAVPWYTLGPGDTVYIHPGTYHEKFQVSTQGTAQNPIRVIGVLDANGNRPIIDGQNATTSTSNHFHWQTPNLVQWDGVVFISINSDAAPLPAYIEIKNLEIKNGHKGINFTAENGAVQGYEDFAAGIYVRAAQHILIENCVVHDNGQGFYNWTGSGVDWWDGLAKDITLRGNYFYNNGYANGYLEHQTYTEADGVVIEYNHYGPMRSGALGNQLKDRSAGTVIRYNYFEKPNEAYMLDLVEPEGAWDAIGNSDKYKQNFVYGNVFYSDGHTDDIIHWNEDHYDDTKGRARVGGKLFFYHNTVVVQEDASGYQPHFNLINAQYGGYECPTTALSGVIDVRNNIIASLPKTPGQAAPQIQFGYCGKENFSFGKNWVSPGYTVHGAVVTGIANLISPSLNDPGFANLSLKNFHLAPGSSAIGIGSDLATEVTSNFLSGNFTPTQQYVYDQQVEARLTSGSNSDLGAFQAAVTSSYMAADFLRAVTDWLKTITSPADANNDSQINSQDLGVMMSRWN